MTEVTTASIKLVKNGPLQATGVKVLDSDGNLLKEGEVYLCRCGNSATKPFCDGAHVKAGFEG